VKRALGWSVAGALLALGLWHAPPSTTAPAGSTAQRLLGPIAPAARDIQWIRFQGALLNGDAERALELAESALALQPQSTDGWMLLAGHLAFDRASAEREPDLPRRRAWFQAGVEVARRGIEHADEPARLHFWRGLLYLSKAEVDPALDPNGADALRLRAIEAFEDATAAGHPDGPEFALYAADPDRELEGAAESEAPD